MIWSFSLFHPSKKFLIKWFVFSLQKYLVLDILPFLGKLFCPRLQTKTKSWLQRLNQTLQVSNENVKSDRTNYIILWSNKIETRKKKLKTSPVAFEERWTLGCGMHSVDPSRFYPKPPVGKTMAPLSDSCLEAGGGLNSYHARHVSTNLPSKWIDESWGSGRGGCRIGDESWWFWSVNDAIDQHIGLVYMSRRKGGRSILAPFDHCGTSQPSWHFSHFSWCPIIWALVNAKVEET